MAAAGWYDDPEGGDRLRYWDGSQWTEHFHQPQPASVLPTASGQWWSTPPSTAGVGGAATSWPERPRSGAGGIVSWLVPTGVLGAIGLAFISVGTKKTNSYYGSSTEIGRTGWLGAAFLCLAAAVFFGHGSFGSLGRVFRGQANLFDALFAGSNVKFVLLSAVAVAGAGVCLVGAIAGF